MGNLVTGIAIGVILVLALMIYADGGDSGVESLTVNLPGLVSGTHTVIDGKVVEKADIRLVAMPYLAATDVKAACTAMNGTWTETADNVGCSGVGPTDCTVPAILSAQTQCIGVHANWYCASDGIYCRY